MGLADPRRAAAAPRAVILAIDDDDAILEYFRFVLPPDYQLLTAPNGPQALATLRTCTVDVVLLDVMLPGMDGLEVLARIRAERFDVEVILVTGLDQTQAAVTGVKLGALEYLTKPFAEDDLLELVGEAVGRRRTAPTSVLVLGNDPGPVASLALCLAPHAIVATAAPTVAGLPDPMRLTPSLVVYDAAAGGPLPVESLRERYTGSQFLVIADGPAAARAAASVPTTPRRIDQILRHIASFTRRLSVLGATTSRLSSHLLRLIDLVAASYRDPLDSRDLASEVGCSVHHLAHQVRDRLGVSLMGYVSRVRVEVARYHLTVSSGSVDDIASDSGFSSASHLSRVFLSQAGYRPGDYRRLVRINGLWPPSVPPSLARPGWRTLPVRSDCTPSVKRSRIRQKLRARLLPSAPPWQPYTVGIQLPPRRRTGVSEGGRCAGCGEIIKQGDEMVDYSYPGGEVVPFHSECERIWADERRWFVAP